MQASRHSRSLIKLISTLKVHMPKVNSLEKEYYTNLAGENGITDADTTNSYSFNACIIKPSAVRVDDSE